MPVQLRSFAQRVEDLVREFKACAGGNLVIEQYNPRPDSDEEDAAQLDGVEPQQLFTGEQFYLGLAVSQLDRKQAIPAISPQRERLLEYDLVRAIARVGATERPMIGLMAALPVLGERFNPFTRQPSEPWVLANELKRDFEVKEVPLSAKEIDKDINVLLVIHPRDPPATEYALDQFVMRGGKLIAFVDPYAYFDQQPDHAGHAGGRPSSSSLPTLFKAWGVEMDPGKVIADVVFGSGGGARYTPTRALAEPHRVQPRRHGHRARSRRCCMRSAARLRSSRAEDLTVTPLVQELAELDAGGQPERHLSGDAATRGFQPSGKAMPLAMRLTGKFKTAFPEGRQEPRNRPTRRLEPAANGTPAPARVGRRELGDPGGGRRHARRRRRGRRAGRVRPQGRGALERQPRVRAGHGGAVRRRRRADLAAQPRGRVPPADGRARDGGRGAEAILRPHQGAGGRAAEDAGAAAGAAEGARRRGERRQILSPGAAGRARELQEDAYIETQLALKELRKNLRQDAEALVFWTKVANIALMPLLVALVGLCIAFYCRRRSA